MPAGQRHYPEERHAHSNGDERRWMLIVSSEPAMLSPAQLVLQEALVERGHVFTAIELLHQPP